MRSVAPGAGGLERDPYWAHAVGADTIVAQSAHPWRLRLTFHQLREELA